MSQQEEPQATTQVGAAVTQARARRGLTIADMASQAGLSRQAVWRIETGERDPQIDTLVAIAEVCGGRFIINKKGVKYAK